MDKFAKIISIVFCATYAQVATSSEFGNVFGSPEIERQSRIASALAVEALQSVLESIRLKELEKESPADSLKNARELLDRSIQEMRSVLKTIPREQQINNELKVYIDNNVGGIISKYNIKQPDNIADLYAGFLEIGVRLMNDIDKSSTFQNNEPIYEFLFPTMHDFLTYAAVVTTVSRISSK